MPVRYREVEKADDDRCRMREREVGHRQPFEIPLTNLSVSEVLNENDFLPLQTCKLYVYYTQIS